MCVPVGTEYEETRQAAIAQMAQIYVEAQCVLVLDPEVQQLNYRSLPDEQIFASVLSSSWNSRSWTFQEACMARVFYVQFADGYCVIDKRWHDFMKRMDKSSDAECDTLNTGQRALGLRDKLMAEVSDWFREMPVMTKIRSYDARTLMTKSEDWQNFVRVWNGLRTRSTTKTDDLYGIMAIMVDLSAYEILKLDPKERMKAILRSQSTLPLSLLYQNCAKLYDIHGRPLWAPSEIAGGHLEINGAYMSVQEDGLLIDVHKLDATLHAWPAAYMFSTTHPLPGSFALRQAGLDLAVSVKLCQSSEEQDTDLTLSWIILFDGPLSHGQTMQNAPGVLLSLLKVEGSMFLTKYLCPLKVSIATPEETISGQEDPTAGAVEAQTIPLCNHTIKVQTGRQATAPPHHPVPHLPLVDLTSWYKPRLRISQRLNSRGINIRNFSNVFEFGAITLTSVLYMASIIGCAVHHHQPLVRKILYLLVLRYFSHFPELYWASIIIIRWDRERTSRWSTRLYGEANVGVWQGVSHVLLNPHIITKIVPLSVGSTSFGLYYTHRWTWAKWFGIIMFTEIGVRLAYTWTITFSTIPNMGRIGRVTREDISDLPEDMTNFSRVWRERNESSWWVRQTEHEK